MAVVQTVLHAGQLHTIGEHTVGHATQQPTSQPPNDSYGDLPHIVHAHEQKALKAEDVIYVRRVAEASYGNVHSVFIVCDGHQGAGAANHCVQHMPGLLGQLLPPHLPDWSNMREVVEYGEKVRRAISTAAVLLDNDWTKMSEDSGTTLTLAVVSGWLLTIANTGDSNAVIDSGDNVTEITYSHRIQVNKSEQNRLRQHGAQLAPLGFHLQGPAKPQEMGVGPLRMWPGGLCVSRSIGDLDAGPLIVPLPHIRQVLLTRRRALRLIMASDGLWDLVPFSKAAKTVRHKLPHQAVTTLIQMVAKDRRMADDVSIIIADLLPPPAPGVTPQQFPASALQASVGKAGHSSGKLLRSSSSSGGGGGLFACFKGPAVLHDPLKEPPSPPAAAAAAAAGGRRSSDVAPGPLTRPWNGLEWFADVDCYEAYPVHGQQLARASIDLSRRPSPPPKRQSDYTVHGGQAHKFQQDSSWHTGNSEHGAQNLPTLLTHQQIQALQDQGPAAAAAMVLSGTGFAYPQQQPQGIAFGSLQGAAAVVASINSNSSNSSSKGHPVDDYRESVLLMMGSGVLDQSVAAAAAAAAGLEGRVRGGSSTTGMTYGLQQQQQQQQQAHSAVSGNSCSNGSTTGYSLQERPTHLLPMEHYIPAAAGGGGGGAAADSSTGQTEGLTSSDRSQSAALAPPASRTTTSTGPASPAPGALLRSASAEFENDGAGVYVAGDGDDGPQSGRRVAAPGRVVGVNSAWGNAADRSHHFGSAPDIDHRNGSRQGAANQGPASLTAAAATTHDDDDDEEESALRRLGVASALSVPAGQPEFGRPGDSS